ncbi:Zn(II)2Cys6 transcription factor domain-containing protein [Aspergillus saccharolyticus JOP 1030-1]|uniref:Zn(2)-C6 fungal-type domain-containing protein n=1 Tax=Aspergillus saccharolyticus JOP 1030-1 TaxID=1450539 RepID=A0A318Z5S7_9EURO|nr:hypothetical protein BP01DRAFT_394141 [Aspergillus saccharolyticus JOP 1030-1]PYH42459.1 hypothetical protein BP01DRAFT_394141 [Aspergillus saccharolyticus JOP 1030-1]
MAQQGSDFTYTYRPIAPKSTQRNKREAPDPPEPQGPKKDKIKRSSTSCVVCKQKRVRCNWEQVGIPCTHCQLQRQNCIVDKFSDRRRKETAEYISAQASYYRGYLEQVIRVFGADDEAIVQAAIEIIQAKLPDEETRARLDALVPPDEQQPSLLPEEEVLHAILQAGKVKGENVAVGSGKLGLDSIPEQT